MDQAIWLYAGIVAAIFVIGIVATIALSGQEQMKEVQINNALSRIKQRTNMVCSSEIGTMVSEKIVLPSGIVLVAGTNQAPKKVCIAYENQNKCESTNCELFYVAVDNESNTFDLNTDFHKQLYQTHEFNCFFERNEVGVSFECKG